MAKGVTITMMGALYRLSKRNWARFVNAQIETEGNANIEDYGARCVGIIDADITDFDADQWIVQRDMIQDAKAESAR